MSLVFHLRIFRLLPRGGILPIGLLLILPFFIAAIFAPILAPFDPSELHLNAILEHPCREYLLGTDSLGRDVFSRLLYGARVSLWVGFISVSISIIIGMFFGVISGYFGGLIDEIIMRFVDVMLCFPSFFLILSVIAFLEPSLTTIMAVIGLTSWMAVTRLVRSETLTLRERDFIAAARLSGISAFRILMEHIAPNVMPPVLVSATLGIAGAILTESSLSFLGLGIQPPDASWGNMLMEGKDVIEIAPWMSICPGLAILCTVLGFNLIGESMQDMIDPVSRHKAGIL
ncbi:MAG: ABC transporter permease [Desulfovibrionaceae bacterium]|nr:ABC transporter permease [Desulfovibrionaceae bacterium]